MSPKKIALALVSTQLGHNSKETGHMNWKQKRAIKADNEYEYY